MAFCTNCGYKIEEGVSFCPQCGTRVEGTAVQESTSQTAAPAASARYIGEDGIEVVPYVPVESPAAAAPVHREAQREAPPAAAQQSAPAAKPAKAPKKGIAKALPFLIIGAVVLLGALIGVVALVYAVLEHGFGLPDRYADYNLGVYNAVQAQVWGVEVDVEDVWADGFSVELKDKGKCTVTMDGEQGSAKWTLKEDVLTIKGGGLDCSGTLDDGKMMLENVTDAKLTLLLEKEGYAAVDIDDPGVPADDGPLTEMQQKWNGTWYGVVNFMECSGKYAAQDYMQYDAYMTVELAEDDLGTVKVWLDPDAPPFAIAQVRANEGGLYATDGQVLSAHMNADNWMFVPAPDSQARYVMPYDSVEDHDGDAFEYVIFMKKWGESWAEERSDDEILPPDVDAYEASIANGDAAPVLESDVPLAQTLAEAIAGAQTSARINMPSNWYGWVEFANWWGNDEPDSLIDAWGTADTNGEMDYFEVYVDDVDTAFYSVYMKLTNDETTILPVVDGGDSWVGDRFIQPGEEEIYRLDLLDDGMLYAEFEFVGASGDYGCDVRMCFREHGQLWDEYEDRLPPRYDEYLKVLAKEAAQQTEAIESPADLPEGDGILSLEQLQAAFDWLDENGSGSTMEEIESHFGVPGEPNTVEDDFCSYRWQTADGSERVLVSFKLKDGKWMYSGMSWTNGLKK